MARRTWMVAFLAAALPQSLALSSSPDGMIVPLGSRAHQYAPNIFNAVNNAMRQWGSSLQHNGMSFFLATVPKGVLLHHGNNSPDSPTEPDWLAYEIEHAENFAHGWHGPGGPGRRPPEEHGPHDGDGDGDTDMYSFARYGIYAPPNLDSPFEEAKDDERPLELRDIEETNGYLHTYVTTRELRFLYVDGMGGGKTNMGTLDSQDYILRGQDPSTYILEERPRHRKGDKKPRLREDKPPRGPGGPGGPMDERQRALDLCELCKQWNLQGVIRMEAGFEIIKCNFSDGLKEVQAFQRPDERGRGGPPGRLGIEFIRGLAERYQGIGAGRTTVDFSSMVSAFLLEPLNLTNPDSKRPDLPRLLSITPKQAAAVRDHLAGVIERRLDSPAADTIDWQGVSDMIVGRYADRIQYMTLYVDSIEIMAREIEFILTVFVDFSQERYDRKAAIDRCTDFYFHHIEPVTESDQLIKKAFTMVSHKICNTLFRVRDLVAVDSAPGKKAFSAAVDLLMELMVYLDWPRFKRCPPCTVDEVCLIPMWPFGNVEDYISPRCTNMTDREDGESYWHMPNRPRVR